MLVAKQRALRAAHDQVAPVDGGRGGSVAAVEVELHLVLLSVCRNDVERRPVARCGGGANGYEDCDARGSVSWVAVDARRWMQALDGEREGRDSLSAMLESKLSTKAGQKRARAMLSFARVSSQGGGGINTLRAGEAQQDERHIQHARRSSIHLPKSGRDASEGYVKSVRRERERERLEGEEDGVVRKVREAARINQHEPRAAAAAEQQQQASIAASCSASFKAGTISTQSFEHTAPQQSLWGSWKGARGCF